MYIYIFLTHIIPIYIFIFFFDFLFFLLFYFYILYLIPLLYYPICLSILGHLLDAYLMHWGINDTNIQRTQTVPEQYILPAEYSPAKDKKAGKSRAQSDPGLFFKVCFNYLFPKNVLYLSELKDCIAFKSIA